jgi:hypothetical protein
MSSRFVPCPPSTLRVALAAPFVGALMLVDCSSSNKGNGDGGDAGATYGTSDANMSSEGGPSDASDGAPPPECVPPAKATFGTQTEAGLIGCMPNRQAGFECPDMATEYKVDCTAPDPNMGVPTPEATGCNLMTNVSAAGLSGYHMYYCCPCGM